MITINLQTNIEVTEWTEEQEEAWAELAQRLAWEEQIANTEALLRVELDGLNPMEQYEYMAKGGN